MKEPLWACAETSVFLTLVITLFILHLSNKVSEQTESWYNAVITVYTVVFLFFYLMHQRRTSKQNPRCIERL